MKKRDINLLESVAIAKTKKNSSSTIALMATAVVVLVGVMVYLFAAAKIEIAKNQDLLDEYQSQLDREPEISQMEQDFEAEMADYKNKVSIVVSEIYPYKEMADITKMTSNFLTYLYDYVGDGEQSKINSITVTDDKIGLNCSTKTYVEAWAFVEFLKASEREVGESTLKCFNEVEIEDSYPGLPTPGDGTDFSISFALNFSVNWEAFV